MKQTKSISKRLLAVMLSLAMVFSLVGANVFSASAAETSGDYEYTVLDDGTVEITDYNGSATELTIPSTLDEKTVTSIGEAAFYNCDSLTSVTIPNSVKSIGKEAFEGCTLLESIEIPDSVESIGYEAFYGTEIYDNNTNWNDGLLYIDNYLIAAKESISGEVQINETTKLIADGAFNSCDSLTSVTIPNSVKSIGYGAFNCCTSLTSISIPNSVTSIDYGAFYYCVSLTSVTIGNSVESIGEMAFNYCTSLKSVTIGNGVKSIGGNAFAYCTALTSIEIPDSVESIGKYVFLACFSLTSIDVVEGNTNYSDIDGVLYNKDKTEIVQYPCGKKDTSYTIPDNVKSIGSGAFGTCDSLESIEIPDSVENIGNSAFSNCTSLTSIEIPNSVESIGESAFYNCNSLTSIEIPNSVESISDYAFYKCSSLTSIVIPNNVESIGDFAFYKCTSLTSVVIPDSVKSIGYGALNSCDALENVLYGGTDDQWEQIDIGDRNDILTTNDTITYCQHTNDETDDAVAPTCEDTGLTEGSHCGDCGKILEAQEVVLALNHSFTGYKSNEDATCTEDGTKTAVCDRENCSATFTVTDEGSATGHDTTLVQEKESTCMEDGNAAYYTCSGCDKWFDDAEATEGITDKSAVVKSAKGHDTQLVQEKEPTCTEDGNEAYYTCSGCDEWFSDAEAKEEIIDKSAVVKSAKGHTEVTDKAVAPTCEKTGKTAGSHCKDCGAKIKAQTVVKAKGHSTTTKNKKSATYFAKGYSGDTVCRVCKKVIKNGKSIAKKVLKTPKVKVTKGKKQFKVKYTKASGATGFQVQYKKGKKTVTKTYSTKKTITKSITKLAKGTYKVKVRAMVKSGKNKAYSKWTKTYTAKVK